MRKRKPDTLAVKSEKILATLRLSGSEISSSKNFKQKKIKSKLLKRQVLVRESPVVLGGPKEQALGLV